MAALQDKIPEESICQVNTLMQIRKKQSIPFYHTRKMLILEILYPHSIMNYHKNDNLVMLNLRKSTEEMMKKMKIFRIYKN